MSRHALLRLGAVAVLALGLSGCLGGLLGGGKPAQLYSFGYHGPAPAAGPAQRSVGVYRANSLFQRETAGDRILAITGDKATPIGGSRWAAPAQVLFDQAVLAAFDASPRVRLLSRGEPAKSDYSLRLDVRNFETRYENGEKAAPAVLVRVRAALTRNQDNSVVGEQIFESRQPAADNRVGAIVAAYDAGVTDVLSKVVPWTERVAR